MLRTTSVPTGVRVPFVAPAASPAQAQIVPTNRLSFVSIEEAGLGNPPDAPDYYEEDMTPSGTFDATLAAKPVAEQPNGTVNFGSWIIDQYSTIDKSRIHATVSQVATVATDFGSPRIFSRSRFLLAFTVDNPVSAELTGAITGSIDRGAADHVQVLLKRNGVSRFDTGFGDTFPFATTLDPGYTYELEVTVSGEAEDNTTVACAASATLTLDPFTFPMDGDGPVNTTVNCALIPDPAQTLS